MRISLSTFPARQVSAGFRRLALVACMGCFTTSTAQAQDDGVCCDPNSPAYDPFVCAGIGDFVGDPDCTSIPLDGGLSLLALAGGGLATAAIRRRRETQEATPVND